MRARVAYAVLTIAAIAGVLAVWAFFTGGFRVYVLGVPLSVRGEHRAAFFAVVLGIIGFVLLDRERRMQKSAIRMLSGEFVRLGRFKVPVGRLFWVVPVAAAAAVLWAGLAFGTRAAGGADSSGYVSQAQLWLRGELHVRDDHPAHVPWPGEAWTFTPLGYRPGTDKTIVPLYAPGLPLLMAVSQLVLGDCGPFMIAPLCAALLVWLTYGLGARVSGPVIGVMASLCIATSPTVLFMSMSPMSDVPTASFWTASLVLACKPRLLATAASGVTAGVAIMIRPNLAPLAVFPMLISVWPQLRAEPRRALRGAVVFALALAPVVLFIAWVFNSLYGSPLQSGYGRASDIYHPKYLPANLARYPRWIWETQGPLPFLFLVAPWLAAAAGGRGVSVRWILLGFVAAVFGSYVAYEPFGAWWFLRFLVPAFPVIFVMAIDAVSTFGSRFVATGGQTPAVLAASIAILHGAAVTYDRDVIHAAEPEHKYADAGRFVAKNLPPRAVVLSMQHSGSVRLYSGRLTLRYDILESHWLDRALDHLRLEGREPYLLLADWEVPRFRKRFAGQKGASLVDAMPLAVVPDRSVLLFSTDGRKHEREPIVIPRTAGCGHAALESIQTIY